MAVSNPTNRAEGVGDGVSTSFPVNFYFQFASDLVVTIEGVLQVLDTDYTVTGAGNPNGGSVEFNTPPANNTKVVIRSIPPFTQLVDVINNLTILESVIGGALDKLTILTQNLQDQLNDTLKKNSLVSNQFWDGQSIELKNIGAPTEDNSAARKIDVDAVTNVVADSANAAASSANSAANSANSAANSAIAAAASADAAANSADDADAARIAAEAAAASLDIPTISGPSDAHKTLSVNQTGDDYVLEQRVRPPSSAVAVGQIPVFNDVNGNTLEGGETGGNPLGIASASDVRASQPGKVIDAGLLSSAAAYVPLPNLTAPDWSSFINAEFTASSNVVIGNFVNPVPGTFRSILLKGNNTTDRSVSFDTNFKGELPEITDLDSTRWYEIYIRCIAADHFVASAKLVLSP